MATSHNITRTLTVIAMERVFDTVRGANFNKYELRDGHGKLFRFFDFQGNLSDYEAGRKITLVTTAHGDFVSVTRGETTCLGCLIPE